MPLNDTFTSIKSLALFYRAAATFTLKQEQQKKVEELEVGAR